jgi:anti-sigma regulatory factor (Ser/Thr protein kinase)/putative methionine-R-sulfoxide reductase with GAF domain
MSTGSSTPGAFGNRLYRIESVTDAALAQLDVEDLLTELLERTRELLDVDTAAVLLLDPSSQHLVATAARGLEEEVRQGSRVPIGKGFAGRIAAEGRTVIIDEVDHANVLNPILREKGVRSLLGVPLVSSGTVMGVLHVGTLSPRRFTQEDGVLLRLVADRIALATQARLSAAERAAATALQRSLFPSALPALVGLELAARYVPGGDGNVGGDWYDVFTLPSGWLCFTVGDVVGRGLFAAAVMGRLRSALRAYALDAENPAELLSKLDLAMQHFEPQTMATVLYAMVDPSYERLQLSCAGHPPPVLAQPGLPPALLELPVDPPLGIGVTRPRRTSNIALPPGASVCFYTDGLVEGRDRPLPAGLERLRRTMSTDPPEAVCAAVMSELLGAHTPTDDVALLVLRRQPPVRTDPLDLVKPAWPTSLGEIRAELRRWLGGIGAGPDDVADLVVAVGEACANVVEHAYGPGGGTMALHLEIRMHDVLATIRDTGRWRLARGQQRGRGITLMRALSDEVHIQHTDTGTQVTLRRRIAAPGHR